MAKIWFSKLRVTTLLLWLPVLLLACGTAAPDTPGPMGTPAADPAPTPVAQEPGQSPPTPVATPAPAATASPDRAGPSGTLNVGLSELGPFGAHPRLANLPAHQVLHTAPIGEALLTFDAEGNIAPLLAREWEISEDFTTWTFHLEQGVQFHKGYGEMTAEDVAWAYNQWTQNPFHARASLMQNFWTNPEGSVETPDPYTVIVNSGSTPLADALVYEFSTIASHGSATSVASKKQTDEIGAEAADRDIAATGPWEIVDHRTSELWRMRAVEDHWRQTPHFAEMVFWEIPEESSRLAGFQTGNLDTFVMAFDSIPLVEQVAGAEFMSVPNAGPMMVQFYGNYYFNIGTPEQRPGYDADLAWVSADPDLNSAEWHRARMVRHALMAAIDTEAIIETLLRGFGRPAVLHDFVSHEHLLDPDMKWEYDPDRARDLLAEAGYPGGGFSITLTPAIRNAPAEVAVCEAIGEMWRDVGVDVRIQRIPFQTFRPTQVSRSYQGAVCFGGRTRFQPVEGFSLIRTDSTSNHGIEHPWLDEKTGQAQRTVDPEARAQLEREVARWLFDNAVGTLAIYSWDTVWPVGPGIKEWSQYVKNFDVRAMNGYEYIQHRE